jgi:hypothetical protein
MYGFWLPKPLRAANRAQAGKQLALFFNYNAIPLDFPPPALHYPMQY